MTSEGLDLVTVNTWFKKGRSICVHTVEEASKPVRLLFDKARG